MPIGHTCGNSMDVPFYSSSEVMKRQLLIAARFCGEIDDDGSYVGESGEEGLNPESVTMTENGS